MRRRRVIYSLPDKLFEIRILCVVCACSVFPFVHGAIYARLEECLGGRVCPGRDKLVELVDISVQITPNKGRFVVGFTSAELELFGDQKDAFFVSYETDEWLEMRKLEKWTYFLPRPPAALDPHPHTLE